MKKLIYLALFAAFMTSCMKSEEHNNSASNEAKTQRFYDEIMNAHNIAMIDSFCTPDFIDHQQDPKYPKGIGGVKSALTDYFTAYPDLHLKTNFMVSKGDTVVVHFTMTGTNSGALMGMPATNRQINIDGVDILVIRNGKAVEHWGYQEEVKMMSQLGMMGEPGGNNPPPSPDAKMEEKK